MSIENKVFVVHGRNMKARHAMYSFLRSIKLEPIEWPGGITSTDKAAPYTLDAVFSGLKSAQCAVILLTGDDLVKLKPEFSQEEFAYQPRPNVIFEAGIALAIMGQEKTVFVTFGKTKLFSDIHGVSLVQLNNSAISRKEFTERLKIAKCKIDENGSDYLNPDASGNFEFQNEEDTERNQDILLRGGFTDYIVDSSLSHSLNSLDLNIELYTYLSKGNKIDLKFSYLGTLCASNWLSLSEDPSYGHSKLQDIIKQNAREIFRYCNFNQETDVDLISLGPGDGIIDRTLIFELERSSNLKNYYPLDLSIELLQKATSEILGTHYLKKAFKVKAIHGDFTELVRYIPIYGYDSSVNIFSLLGFTLGNFNESELIGKIKEGMNEGDFLLIDARLHNVELSGHKLTEEEKSKILSSYQHNSNNRFAFGPVESVTTADFRGIKFDYNVNQDYTVVNSAINIITYCVDLNTKYRHNFKQLKRDKLNLSLTTLYSFDALCEWFIRKGFYLIWKKDFKDIGLLLLQKEKD